MELYSAVMTANQKSADIPVTMGQRLFINSSAPVRVMAKNTAPGTPTWAPVAISYWEDQETFLVPSSVVQVWCGDLPSRVVLNTSETTAATGDPKIVNVTALHAALERARRQRVAIIGIGDSNQAFNAAGWAYHWTKNLAAEYGCFGTGLMPMGQQYGGQLGQYKAAAGRGNAKANTGAPAGLAVFAPDANAAIGNGGTSVTPTYAYIASADTLVISSINFAMTVNGDHPMGVSGNTVMFRMSYGTFTAGSTTYTPRLRYENTPYATIADGATINPIAASNGIVDYTVTAAIANNGFNVSFCPHAINATLTGPFFGLYASAENPAKTSGISFQSLVYYAGHNLGDFNDALSGFGTTALNEYFRQIGLQLTGSPKSAIIIINGGVNDLAATVASRGPNPQTPANGIGAYGDNLDGLIAKLRAGWGANGFDQGMLHICVMVSHPQANPDPELLVGYREIAERFCSTHDNMSCIQIPRFASFADFAAGDWWDAGGHAHLKPAGYDAVTSRAVGLIR